MSESKSKGEGRVDVGESARDITELVFCKEVASMEEKITVYDTIMTEMCTPIQEELFSLLRRHVSALGISVGVHVFISCALLVLKSNKMASIWFIILGFYNFTFDCIEIWD